VVEDFIAWKSPGGASVDRADGSAKPVIVSKLRGVRVGEVWFDEEPNCSAVDVLRYLLPLCPIRRIPSRNRGPSSLTLRKMRVHTDCLQEGTRYEVKRAGTRDPITYYAHDVVGPSVVNNLRFLRSFFGSEGLTQSSAELPANLAGHDTLVCSKSNARRSNSGLACLPETKRRVRLLHAPSLFREHFDSDYRNMIGRANRYHHWRDMLPVQVLRGP